MRSDVCKAVGMNLVEASLGLVYGLLVCVFHRVDVMDGRTPDELLLLLFFIGIFVGVRFSHTLYTYGARMLTGGLIAVAGFAAPVIVLYRGTPALSDALLMTAIVPVSALALWLWRSRCTERSATS